MTRQPKQCICSAKAEDIGRKGALIILLVSKTEPARTDELMKKYSDTPMDLASDSLLAQYEAHN